VREIFLSTGKSRPCSLAIVDFNNDKTLDLVASNYGTDSVSFFSGYGNGSFSNSNTY
jgi:hypothetical protein